MSTFHVSAGGAVGRFTREVDLAADASGLSTGWQLVIGSAAGIALVTIALVIGGWFHRRTNERDEVRKAQLRAQAEKTGTDNKVSFTEIDLTDSDDFGIAEPVSSADA